MNETSGFETDEEENTEYWLNISDRGGLYHINDKTYYFFYYVELEIKKYYNFRKVINEHVTRQPRESKKAIIKEISENEEVLYQWEILTEGEEHLQIVNELYEEMINELLTIRGFSFATSIVEAYKKLSHKNLQKNKGLEKQYFNS